MAHLVYAALQRDESSAGEICMPVKPGKSRLQARAIRARAPRAAPPIADEPVVHDPLVHDPAGAIVAGLQEVGAEVTAYAESTTDQAMHLARSLIDAASLSDVLALQQKFAQANFATLVAGSARVAEIGLRMIGSAALPHEPLPDEPSADEAVR
jgi:hypothetical protein